MSFTFQDTYAAMLPDKVIYDILYHGFTALHSDQSILGDLFVRYNDETRKDIEQFYAQHKITVRSDFPRDPVTFPIVTVVSTSEQEDTGTDLLGDFENATFNLARNTRASALGHAMQSEIEIYCLAAKDAFAAMWLYYVAKALLLINIPTLGKLGLHNVTMKGQNLQLREDLFPEMVYGRVLAVSCLNYFSVQVTERVANALISTIFTEDQETGRTFSLEG